MAIELPRSIDRRVVLGLAAFAYFVAYPEDLSAILSPVEGVLRLSNDVSPWLYVVLGAGVVAWAIIRTFGRPRQPTWEGETPR